MTIIDKLNLMKYINMTVINQPSDYEIFNGYNTTLTGEHDAIFIFVETIDDMVKHTQWIIKEKLLINKGY